MARTVRSLQTAAVLVLIFYAAAIAFGQDGGKAIHVEPVDVPQSWALLVGVNAYADMRPLKYCIYDMKSCSVNWKCSSRSSGRRTDWWWRSAVTEST